MWLLSLLGACELVRYTPIGDSGQIDDPCDRLWYADQDGDGFGAGEGEAGCTAPADRVGDDSDCNDSDPDVHPDAKEICEDGQDNDCDGTARGCTPAGIRDINERDPAIYGEQDDDGVGAILRMAGDLNGDGFGDLVLGAPYANGATGHASVHLGPLAQNTTLRQGDRSWAGPVAGDYLGFSVTRAGDLNGDGFGDLAIGARGDDQIAGGAGAVYLIHGPALDPDLAEASGVLLGRDAGEEAGSAVHGCGDLDGDGMADLMIGAPGHHDGGRTYVVHGPVTATYNLAIADAVLNGQSTSDGAGARLACGDLDGDGYVDHAVGAPSADGLASDGGMVYIAYGPLSGEVSLDQADGRIFGASWERIGISVAVPGDLDGDAPSELVVGSPYVDGGATDQGRAYVFLDPVLGSIAADAATVILSGEADHDNFATDLFAAGDMDGDGWPDLVVGAPYNDFSGGDSGAAYLFYGPLLASRTGETADAKFTGPEDSERLGSGVAGQGDLDGDGLDDLALGALGVRRDGRTTGGVYAVLSGNRL